MAWESSRPKQTASKGAPPYCSKKARASSTTAMARGSA
jgi:hypothetical protein